MGDKKATPLSGTKTEDSKREGEVTDAKLVAGADQYLSDTRQSVSGDNTSSSQGANNPGQHGRDGGEIGGQTNNPTPSEAAISGEEADASDTDSTMADELKADAEPKKL